MSPIRQRFSFRAFKICRVCVRLITTLVLLLLCSFLYLRLFGVPGPLLREAIRRVNSAGIPVDVESVTLTLRGWRAENVRYYSKHPDDLEPLFIAEQFRFKRIPRADSENSNVWKFDVEGSGISINPSVEWGIEVPDESQLRKIDEVSLSLGFYPDRIVLNHGELSWIGIDFDINGTILKKAHRVPEPAPGKPDARKPQETVLPVYVDAERFQRLEERLKSLTILGETAIGIDFMVDAGDYSKSTAEFTAKATDIELREIGFSGLELEGSYVFPQVVLNRASLYRDNHSFSIAGNYNLESEVIEGSVENTIISKRLLLLLPQPVMDVLVKIQLSFEYLPQFSLAFGPAKLNELHNAIDGRFSIEDVFFRGLEIDSLSGRIERKNDRLDLKDLSGRVLDQKERAAETGSCMAGGSATGSCFWDAAEKTFGVTAAGSFDPTLMIRPLDMVKEATNVLHRFRFSDRPPEVSLELGSSLVNWKTFYINVHALANDAFVHDVEFSSVNASAYYYRGVLRLDPVAAMQGVDFMKGSASIDFLKDRASFDAFGSLKPKTIEDVVYPNYQIFGHKIIAEGNTQIKASGTFDWKTMQATDFEADVEADELTIPVAKMNGFKAKVIGDGPRLTVTDAEFGLYEGAGKGTFRIQLDPATNAMPYEMQVNIKEADFRKCLQFLRPDVEYTVTGNMEANIDFGADMSRHFFDSANGSGFVAVKDGQLADLPFFSGFSRLIRRVIPSFNVFSITSLQGNFALKDGVIRSEDAYFEGDVISAKGSGTYSYAKGFDAVVQAQMLSDKGLSKIVRVITDPILKLFEMKLTGTLANPTWRLEKLPSTSDSSN